MSEPPQEAAANLGTINDSGTAIRLAERLAREERPDLAVPAAALAESRTQASGAATRKLKKQWRAFQRQRRCWR